MIAFPQSDAGARFQSLYGPVDGAGLGTSRPCERSTIRLPPATWINLRFIHTTHRPDREF
jgi:hypothetical protein